MKYVRSNMQEGGGDIQVVFSGIIERRDRDLGEKIKDIIERLKRFSNNKFFIVIDNRNVDENSLNKSLLHLSRYENRFLSGNLINTLKGF